MLLLNINKKSKYGVSIGLITFDLSDIERSMSRSLRFSIFEWSSEVKVKVLKII